MTEMKTIVYDLNIFQEELENSDGSWEHQGPWYIHIYEYDDRTTEEVSEPIELTAEETANLITNDAYFENEVDVWYGLEGFVQDKLNVMSDRLRNIFECLPKEREEALA
jgi:hypothetical protein